MICHVDADSFFASVLVRKHPHLQGKPLLATGMGGGCVIAASYESKAFGVKTGMPLREAMALCPDAVRMSSDFQEAGLASQQIEELLLAACPVIEQTSIDEWYMDLSAVIGGVPKDPHAWAFALQKTVQDKTGLWVSAGVAPSKLLAKMAGEYKKPRGVTIVDGRCTDVRFARPHTYSIKAFLQDRPAPAIPGIGHRRKVHVETRGWKTAWDIATAPRDEMVALCGRPGADMQRELLGERLFDVETESAPPKSVSRARSFRRETDPKLLWAHLLRHAEYTILKMRRHDLACRGVSVWLRDDRFGYESAHASLPQPSSTEDAVLPHIQRCLRKIYRRGAAYTQIGLALWRLEPQGALQFSLFEEADKTCRSEEMQKTLDEIHRRFGRNAITRGAALRVKSGTKIGFEMPTYE